MSRSTFNATLCLVGVAIVAAFAVLFVECKRIVDDPVAGDSLFARTVLDDVFRSFRPSNYPMGMTRADFGWALYPRVSLYMLIGFAFIAAGWARQYGFWAAAERPKNETESEEPSD